MNTYAQMPFNEFQNKFQGKKVKLTYHENKVGYPTVNLTGIIEECRHLGKSEHVGNESSVVTFFPKEIIIRNEENKKLQLLRVIMIKDSSITVID